MIEVIKYLKERLDNADARPIVKLAPNGDRNPITVDHAVMDRVLRSEAFQADAWKPLKDHRLKSANISQEYPGMWIRSILVELKKGGE